MLRDRYFWRKGCARRAYAGIVRRGFVSMAAWPANNWKRAYAGAMFTDRRFRSGARMGAATGWMKGGWAVSFSGSRRWGRDTHIDGVYSDNWTVYGSVARKVGPKHVLSAAFLMAPSDQGVRGAATSRPSGDG